MLFFAESITATGLAVIAASRPSVRRGVRVFFAPAGRHRAAPKSD